MVQVFVNDELCVKLECIFQDRFSSFDLRSDKARVVFVINEFVKKYERRD